MNCTTKSLKIIKNTFINLLTSQPFIHPPRFVDQIFLDRTQANQTKERVSYDKSCFLGCEDCSAKAKERKKKRKERKEEEKRRKERRKITKVQVESETRELSTWSVGVRRGEGKLVVSPAREGEGYDL